MLTSNKFRTEFARYYNHETNSYSSTHNIDLSSELGMTIEMWIRVSLYLHKILQIIESSTPSQTDILTISKEERSAEFIKLQMSSNYKISITTNTNNTSLTIPQNLHSQWFMLTLTSVTISKRTFTTITIHSSSLSTSTLTYNSSINTNIHQISI